MKRLLSFLLLFSLLMQLTLGYAQGETFAPIGAEWYHTKAGISRPYRGYIKSTSVKDSVIDGKTCRIINSMIVEPYSSEAADTTYQEAAMILYTTPDTVYYLNREIERFIPLYIFNVNVGDTVSYRTPYTIPNVPEFPPEDTIFRILITDVSTTDVSGVSLKTISYAALDKWGFSWGPDTDGYYMERIGTSRAGLLSHEPIVGYLGNSHGPSLRCYIDEVVSYPSSIEDMTCDYISFNTSISDNQINGDLQIYPNPAKDYLRIRNTDGNHSVISVKIYNILGKKIKTVVFENAHQEQILSVTDLPAGTYILQIRSKEHSVNRKLTVH